MPFLPQFFVSLTPGNETRTLQWEGLKLGLIRLPALISRATP
jgi:hypothetical protein